jgi:hypothetical protein
MCCALVLVASPIAPLLAADEAAAAMARMISTQEAVLELLDTIHDAAGLEQARPALAAALGEAETAGQALAGHAAELESSEELKEEFTPQLQALYALRNRVQEDLRARLDPATVQALEAILSGN